MAEPRFLAPEGLVVSGEGAARYLTDLGSGQVYELNETALVVFEAVRRGATAREAVAALAARYPEVPPDEIARDTREMLDEMVRSGVLRAIP